METLLYVETISFFGWLSSIAFTLFWFMRGKYRSIYNADCEESMNTKATTNEGEAYFWKRKDSDDFLRYVKREVFEVGYFLSSFFVTAYIQSRAKDWTRNKELDSKQSIIVFMLYGSRIWAISHRVAYLFRYYKKTPEQRRRMIIVKNSVQGVLTLLTLIIFVGGLVIDSLKITDFSTIL